MRSIAFVSLVAVSLVGLACPASAADVRLPIPGGRALVLPAPDGWQANQQPGPIPTLSLTPAEGNAFQVMVSPLITADGKTAPVTRDSLRRLVEAGAGQAKAQSVEKSLPIQRFGSGGVQGSYFSATDRAPRPGEYKYMTQGTMSVSGLPVSFTILSNGDPHAAVQPALRMLVGSRRE